MRRAKKVPFMRRATKGLIVAWLGIAAITAFAAYEMDAAQWRVVDIALACESGMDDAPLYGLGVVVGVGAINFVLAFIAAAAATAVVWVWGRWATMAIAATVVFALYAYIPAAHFAIPLAVGMVIGILCRWEVGKRDRDFAHCCAKRSCG